MTEPRDLSIAEIKLLHGILGTYLNGLGNYKGSGTVESELTQQRIAFAHQLMDLIEAGANITVQTWEDSDDA